MTYCSINLKEFLQNVSTEKTFRGRYFISNRKRKIRISYALNHETLYIHKISIVKLKDNRYRRQRKLLADLKTTISTASQTDVEKKKKIASLKNVKRRKQSTTRPQKESEFLKKQVQIQNCIISQLADTLKSTHEKTVVMVNTETKKFTRTMEKEDQEEEPQGRAASKTGFWRQLILCNSWHYTPWHKGTFRRIVDLKDE